MRWGLMLHRQQGASHDPNVRRPHPRSRPRSRPSRVAGHRRPARLLACGHGADGLFSLARGRLPTRPRDLGGVLAHPPRTRGRDTNDRARRRVRGLRRDALGDHRPLDRRRGVASRVADADSARRRAVGGAPSVHAGRAPRARSGGRTSAGRASGRGLLAPTSARRRPRRGYVHTLDLCEPPHAGAARRGARGLCVEADVNASTDVGRPSPGENRPTIPPAASCARRPRGSRS